MSLCVSAMCLIGLHVGWSFSDQRRERTQEEDAPGASAATESPVPAPSAGDHLQLSSMFIIQGPCITSSK